MAEINRTLTVIPGTNVTVIEGQVADTVSSDANLKENFLAVDGEETLDKIGQMTLESWNYKGHDPSSSVTTELRPRSSSLPSATTALES